MKSQNLIRLTFCIVRKTTRQRPYANTCRSSLRHELMLEGCLNWPSHRQDLLRHACSIRYNYQRSTTTHLDGQGHSRRCGRVGLHFPKYTSLYGRQSSLGVVRPLTKHALTVGIMLYCSSNMFGVTGERDDNLSSWPHYTLKGFCRDHDWYFSGAESTLEGRSRRILFAVSRTSVKHDDVLPHSAGHTRSLCSSSMYSCPRTTVC